MAEQSEQPSEENTWEMYTDGSSSSEGSGAGFVLIPPGGGEPLRYALALTFRATNNEAEYEALITGLKIAKGTGVGHLKVKCDASLIVNQVKGHYEAKSPMMRKYLREVQVLKASFKSFDIEAIPREENVEADALSKFALGVPLEENRKVHFLERVILSTTDPSEVCAIDAGSEEEEPTWMTPIVAYLATGALPDDRVLADRICRIAADYALVDDQLYKKGYFSTPYLKCVAEPDATRVLRELHEGIAACHEGARSIVRKVLNLGYYWPTMSKDAMTLVRSCDACQRYAPNITAPAANLTSIRSAWPFAQWGIDLVGPLKQTTGQCKYLLVAIDYFSKWIEAKPLAKTTGKQIIKFLQTQIVARYGVPKVLISDNGPPFNGAKLEEYLKELNIEHRTASVHHAQTNGQVEAANKIVMEGLKKRVFALKGKWLDQLENVLWAVRTTPKRSTGETPYGLVYGTEAVAPVEIAVASHRARYYEPMTNDEIRRLELDLLEEKRREADEVQARMRLATARYYNRRVKSRQFFVGELVWRRNEFTLQDRMDKMSPKWEGPYKVVGMPAPNAYKLEGLDGKKLKHSFSGEHLKKCHV